MIEFKIEEVKLLKKLPIIKVVAPNTKKGYTYIVNGEYLCFCGNIFVAKIKDIKRGHTRSCGCFYKYSRKNNKKKTHGESQTRLFKIWLGIKKRCFLKTHKTYKLYGARGITICESWLSSYEVFRDWSLENGYLETLSIDRINVDGHYEPKNCRWTNNTIQNINKRNIVNNTSGFLGVSLNKTYRKNPWVAQININGKGFSLGRFATPEEASEAYQKAKKERDITYLKEFENNK